MKLPGKRELSENRPTQSSRREPASKGQKVEEEVQGRLRRRARAATELGPQGSGRTPRTVYAQRSGHNGRCG